jgi:type I restriction enzyme, R subunit
MSANEAQARIKINRLLEKENWRFFDDANGPANVRLEPGVKITRSQLDALGNNFENAKGGRIDYLLLDSRNFPLVVLEAKAESKHPLVGKEQAREYAISQKCRFVLLSNGNEHYFWDLDPTLTVSL